MRNSVRENTYNSRIPRQEKEGKRKISKLAASAEVQKQKNTERQGRIRSDRVLRVSAPYVCADLYFPETAIKWPANAEVISNKDQILAYYC